jgi:uncharacterized membrane protein YhaH (DUF805 family)
VMTKRLHDRDKSGWWLLLFFVLPLVLLAIATLIVISADTSPDAGTPPGFGIAVVCSVVVLALAIWAIIELGCLPGTPGPNKYGADPLAGRDVT